jgi:hypothetical protein
MAALVVDLPRSIIDLSKLSSMVFAFLYRFMSRSIRKLVRVRFADLKSKTRVWIRRIRRDQRSDTDQTELRSNPVERAQY